MMKLPSLALVTAGLAGCVAMYAPYPVAPGQFQALVASWGVKAGMPVTEATAILEQHGLTAGRYPAPYVPTMRARKPDHIYASREPALSGTWCATRWWISADIDGDNKILEPRAGVVPGEMQNCAFP